jgi:hypothetical protein
MSAGIIVNVTPEDRRREAREANVTVAPLATEVWTDKLLYRGQLAGRALKEIFLTPSLEVDVARPCPQLNLPTSLRDRS